MSRNLALLLAILAWFALTALWGWVDMQTVESVNDEAVWHAQEPRPVDSPMRSEPEDETRVRYNVFSDVQIVRRRPSDIWNPVDHRNKFIVCGVETLDECLRRHGIGDDDGNH